MLPLLWCEAIRIIGRGRRNKTLIKTTQKYIPIHIIVHNIARIDCTSRQG